MVLMILGLVLFLGVHTVRVVPRLRGTLAAAVGEGAFKVLYSLLAAAGLVLVVVGYGEWRAAGPAILYEPPAWTRHVALLLMLVAFILLTAAYVPGTIRHAVRHPMLLAVKVWALAHLIANGDAASVTLFAAFLAWAVVDRISVAKRERAGEINPRAFVPRLGADLFAVATGSILYAVFVWKLHLWLIGVSPIVIAAN